VREGLTYKIGYGCILGKVNSRPLGDIMPDNHSGPGWCLLLKAMEKLGRGVQFDDLSQLNFSGDRERKYPPRLKCA